MTQVLQVTANPGSPVNSFVFIFTKTIKTLLLIFSFQDNRLALMVYAPKQVYVIYHQHQPPGISCAEISKSKNIKKAWVR